MKKILVAVALASLVAFASPALAEVHKAVRICGICNAEFDNNPRAMCEHLQNCSKRSDSTIDGERTELEAEPLGPEPELGYPLLPDVDLEYRSVPRLMQKGTR